MKFLVGVILSAIITSLLFIGAWFYFDFPIDTNNEQQTYQQKITEDNTPTNEATDSQSTNFPTEQELDDTADNWMQTYKAINEGTEETPYVTINGEKVNPKFVINENGSLSQEYLQREEVN